MKKLYLIWTLLGLLFAPFAWAQNNVTGTVNDETGTPLPGATVIVDETNRGVATDFDGNFSIDAEQGEVLVITYIGYADQRLTVGSQDNYTINLSLDNELEKVVITALGRSKSKEKLGYAISEVGSEELDKANSDGNVVNSLAGRVSGVRITNSSGDIGSSSRITIRGNSSILGDNQALFVVDGVPIDNSTLSTGRGNYGTNRAGDLDMTNIESITVLKGGAATLLYGERAYWDDRPFNYPNNGGVLGFVGKENGDPTGSDSFSPVGPNTYYGKENSPQLIAIYFELRFIEAEAALRAGNSDRAATALNAAVKAQLDLVTPNVVALLNKEGGDVDAYNDQVDAYKTAFASETSTSVTLDKIMTEKYKAMFTMNIETLTDLRRHDFAYPSGGYLSLPNEATLPQFIRRGLYPQAEIDNNFDNVPTGISMTDRLWWDRN